MRLDIEKMFQNQCGAQRDVYSKMFPENAKKSFGHAKKIGEKISAMAGVPSIERNTVQQSDDVMEILEHAIAFERKAVQRKAVQLYSEALTISDERDRALTVLLKDILLKEQDGVDHIDLILR